MLYFSLELFVKNLDELKELPDEKEITKEDRLKEIVLIILEGQIDYSAFTYEEIKEIYERACDWCGDELFKSIKSPHFYAKKINNLPRRRNNHVFI